MTRTIAFSFTVLTLLVFALTARLEAGGIKSDSEVKIKAKATKPDASGKQVVTITMVHNPDWHTYANPVGNEDFAANQTVVSIKAAKKLKSVSIDYPRGHLNKDKASVYEGAIEITATVERAEGDTSPLEVSVRIVACNDKRGTCLAPATVKIKPSE